MTYFKLKRYLELKEEIRRRQFELGELRSEILREFGGEAGFKLFDGVLYGAREIITTSTDNELLCLDLGVEEFSKYQVIDKHLRVFVEPTTGALK